MYGMLLSLVTCNVSAITRNVRQITLKSGDLLCNIAQMNLPQIACIAVESHRYSYDV